MRTDELNANIELVLRYFEALKERDINAIMLLLAKNINWCIPGNEAIAPWVGVRTNKNQIKDALELLWLNTEPISGTIAHIAADENVVICSGEFESLMLKTGKTFKSLFFTKITVVDGLIVKYTLLEDTFGLVRALSN